MEETFSGALPLYQQIRNYLEDLILDGQLEPGDKLPSEKDLQNQFGVSRITARRALQDLSNEGKIQRVAGKGSFVLKPKIEPLTALTSFSENMIAQGYKPSYRNAEISIITPSSKIKETLKLQEGERVAYLAREMLANGLPMALQEAYFSERIFLQNPSLFTIEILNNISFYKVLEIELGIHLNRAEESVDAALAREDEALKLNINTSDVVLIINRTTFDIDDRPTEFVKLVFPAERYRYKVELFRPSKTDNT
jgi:GntR family transcriptional regulator